MMTIAITQLATVQGGMNLDGFRRSEDIEDRRTPADVQEDDRWMASLKDEQDAKDFARGFREGQVVGQLRQTFDGLQRAGTR